MSEHTSTAIIDTLAERHRIRSAHRCSCGWEGDSATTHIIDTLGLRPVRWEWDDYERAVIRPSDQMPDDPTQAPLYTVASGRSAT